MILALLGVGILPLLGLENYHLNIAVIAFAFVTISAAFNLIFGYTGWLSLAQVGFWGLGAYTAALLVLRLGVSQWIAFLAGGLVASLAALLLGIPSLRLSRSAFIIVSLAFTLLLELLARDWVALTRGAMGLPSLPAPEIHFFNMELALLGPRQYYYLMMGMAVATLLVIHQIVSSRVGRALVAIRENEDLALSQGIDALRYKIFALVVSAGITGVAGGVFVFYLSIVDPTILSFFYLQALVIIVMVGGPGSFWGVVFAAIFFAAVPELLRLTDDLRLVLFGVALILVTLFLPHGIGGYIRKRRSELSQIGAAPQISARDNQE